MHGSILATPIAPIQPLESGFFTCSCISVVGVFFFFDHILRDHVLIFPWPIAFPVPRQSGTSLTEPFCAEIPFLKESMSPGLVAFDVIGSGAGRRDSRLGDKTP
jgi:hypothetical protein